MNDQLLLDIVDRVRNRFYGKYRGTVTQVDTNQKGRIKARVPAVLGDTETGWCMPCVPYAGDQAAIAFLPELESGVWIEFEGGDVSYPIWVGAYWHEREIPSEVEHHVKVIRTPGKQMIILDDNNKSITIKDDSGNSVTMDQKGIAIVREKGSIVIKNKNINMNDNGMEVT